MMEECPEEVGKKERLEKRLKRRIGRLTGWFMICMG